MVLKCQVKDHEDSSLQWSNPAQQTLYFGEKRGSVPRVICLHGKRGLGKGAAELRGNVPVVQRLRNVKGCYLGKQQAMGSSAGSRETS